MFVTPRALSLPILVAAATLAPLSSHAADVVKANNTTALNVGTSWVGGAVLGTSDVAVWNSTVTGANTSVLGADLSWQGIRIANPGGAIVIGAVATNTLTLGSAGIDMTAATQNLTILSNLSIGANQTWNVAAGRTLQIQNVNTNTRLSGSGNLTLARTGSGVANFTFNPGSNTSTGFNDQFGFYNYTGNWTIGEGVFVRTLRNGRNAWGTGSITLAGGTLAQHQNFSGTWNNNIILQSGTTSTLDDANSSGSRSLKLLSLVSGSGNLVIAETGAASHAKNGGVILTNTNTLSGTVTINAGAVLRVGGVFVADNVDASAGTSGTLGTSSVVINSTGALTLSRSNTWTFDNSVSGAGTLHIGGGTGALVSGANTQIVTLTGTNSYSGGTELVQGTLKVAELAKIGSGYLAVKGGGIFEYTGSGSETTARSLFLDNGAATINVSDAAGSLTLNPAGGTLGAAGASFTKSGAGTLVFGGALGAASNQTVTVSAGRLNLTGVNTYTGATTISGGTLELSGTGTLGSGSYAGAITNAAALEFTGSATQTLSGAITGVGSLTRAGTGTLTLSSTSNSFTGGTTISGGTLTLGAAGVLANSGTVTVSGGIFNLGTFAETVGTVNLSSGTIQNGTLTSGSGFSLTGGTVAANAILAGSVGLTKSGVGAATLNGSHTYTGATSVSNGRLTLATGASVASNAYVISAGAELEAVDGLSLTAGKSLSLGTGLEVAAGAFIGNLTLNGGSLNIDFGASSNDLLAVTGDITLTAGSIAFAKSSSYSSGKFTIATYTGTLTGNPGTFTLTGLASDGTSRQTFALIDESSALKLEVGGAAEIVAWVGNVSSRWDASGTGVANWLVTNGAYSGDQPNRFFNGDEVVFGDGVTTGQVEIGASNVSPASITFNAATQDYTVTSLGGVVNSGALTKSGLATLTLQLANTYAGGTTLSAGRIRIGADNALGTGTIAVSGGSLSSDSTTGRTLANNFSLTSNLTLGNATDNGALTLSGAFNLNAQSRTLTLASDATISGAVTSGSLVKAGAGKLTFTGNNVLGVNLDIQAGTVALGSSGAIADAATVNVASGATFDLATFSETLASLTVATGGSVTAGTISGGAITLADATTFAATLTGTTSLTKNGSATIDLANASVRSGATTLSSGGIRVADNAALGTGTLALNGGTFTADATGRTLANATTIGGNVTLGEAGAGLLTFSSALNLGGGTRVITTDSNVRFSGAVSNGSLTKAGNGTLTLSAAGTMTATAIQAGKIEMVGTVNSLGTGGIALTDGAELALSMSAASVTVANTFTGTGRVAKNTTNRFFITGDNSNAVIEWYWASNDVAGSTGGLGFSSGAAFGGAGSKITVADGITASAFINATGQSAAVGVEISNGGTYQWNGSSSNTNTFTGVISGGGTFTKISGETLIATGVHTHTGALNISAGILQIAQSGQLGQGNFGGATAITSTLYYNSDAAQELSGIVSGGGTLRKGNSSTLTLSGANTLTGQTLVEQGTVRLTGSQTGASNTNKVVNVATVAGQTAAYEVAGGNLSLTGTNSLIIGDLGTGTFTLTSGTVSLGSGGVWVGDAANTAVGTLNIQGGSFTSSGALVVATRGTGTVNVTGGSATFGSISLGHAAGTGQSATVNLGAVTVTTGSITGQAVATTRDLSINGTTIVAAGSTAAFLQDLTSAKVGSNGVTFDTNGFNITVAQALTENASSLGGGLTKTGAGTLTLSGINTYTGGTLISSGTLLLNNLLGLGTGTVTVAGGILDLNNLAPTNVISLTGGSLLNASAWAALGAVQLSGNVDSSVINNLGADIAEVSVVAGATVNLTGVTKDIVFEGGTLTNLTNFGSDRKVKVKGNLDISSGDHGGVIEVASGGTLDFGNRSTDRSVKFAGGAITGANFTGNVDVDSAAGTVALTSSIGAGNVRLGNGASASIQSGFNRDLRLETGATLSGLDNYAGELTVAAPTFSTTGITTSATIAIESGTTLTGSGSVGAVVQAAGSTLAPGNSPGLLTTGTATLAGGSAMEVEFFAATGTRGTAYDAVTVTGELNLSGLTNLSRYTLNLISLSALPDTQGPLAGFTDSTAYIYQLFTYATLTLPGSYTGNIANLFTIDTTSFADSSGNLVTGSWTVFNNTGTNTLELQYSPIPEPSTYGLILGGLALAGAAIRRRKNKR